MSAVYFYQDTTTGLLVLRFDGYKFEFPAGSLVLITRDADSLVNFNAIRTNQSFFQNTNGPILPEWIAATSILKESGVAYASVDALKAAMKAAFSGSEASGVIDRAFQVEITRPDNTTVYTAGDVVADVSAAFVPIPSVAKSTGAGVKVIRVRLQTSDTGVASKKFNVHLYREAPTFIPDNDQFVISYANATKRIGAIPIVMGTGNLGTVGMNDYDVAIINPTARDVYYIIETVDGFTPSGASTKFQVSIDCELSN